jgi:hypothetical protein
MPRSKPSGEQRRRGERPSVLRAAADELGITTPKEATRRRRKSPVRVKGQR